MALKPVNKGFRAMIEFYLLSAIFTNMRWMERSSLSSGWNAVTS